MKKRMTMKESCENEVRLGTRWCGQDESRGKRIFNAMRSIFIFVLVGAIIILLTIFILSKMGNNEIPNEYCKQLGGDMWFYECQSIPFATPCSELKTGYWCELPNNVSLSINDIWRLINSTN